MPNNKGFIQNGDGGVQANGLVQSPAFGSQAAPAATPYNGMSSNFRASDDGHDSGGLDTHWRAIVRHIRLILLAGAIGLISGLLIGLPMKPVYRARTSLEILNVNEDFMNMKIADPVVAGENSGELSEQETQATLLRSDALMARVYAKLDAIAPAAPRSTSSKVAPSSDLTPPGARRKLLDKAAGSLNIINAPRTRVLQLSVDSTDPRLAVDFANTLVSEFLQKNMEARWQATHQTDNWLTSEIEDAKAQLRSSENILQTYARNSGLVFTDGAQTTNIATEKLQRLQQELSTASTDRIAKQATFELARNSPLSSLSIVINDPGLQQISTRLQDSSRQLASLSAVFKPSYSKVAAAQAEVETLQHAFTQQRGDLLARIESDYKDSRRKEKLLEEAYELQTREVAGQDERAVQYNMLKRDVDSNRQLYDTLLQQMKQAAMATALHTSNVRIVDPAYLLPRPISPNFKMNALLGLIVGVFGSMLGVLAYEQGHRTFRHPHDVRLCTDLPELGAIPRFEDAKKRKFVVRRAQHGLRAQTAEKQLLLPAPDVSGLADLLAGWHRPGPVSESFRAVLASILIVHDKRVQPQVLVVTSAEAGDGKTTIVSNLAIASAELGEKVLLIDADLRRPRIHTVFGLSNEHGLVELLQSNERHGTVAGMVQTSGIPYLSVITAGTSKTPVAQIFYSAEFKALLAKLKQEYSLILIDTPPVLPVTDARIIGRQADAVVLVARAGQTTREAMLAARDRLEEDQIRVLGTVLNDWNPSAEQVKQYRYIQDVQDQRS